MEDPVARFAVGLGLVKKGFSELTGYIKMAFEAFKSFDTAIVGTARNLGLSRDQVKNFTIEAVQSQSVFNDGLNQNVYSSEQIAKSLTDVNSQLGLSVTLSQGTINEFTKMTQTMGLSVEEATQIYRFGVLNNKSLNVVSIEFDTLDFKNHVENWSKYHKQQYLTYYYIFENGKKYNSNLKLANEVNINDFLDVVKSVCNVNIIRND
jgi:galactitol-specific phosphotransferase system IIB component